MHVCSLTDTGQQQILQGSVTGQAGARWSWGQLVGVGEGGRGKEEGERGCLMVIESGGGEGEVPGGGNV